VRKLGRGGAGERRDTGPEGLQQSAFTGSKTPISEEGGAKCGAISAELDPRSALVDEADADLRAVIAAWPTLSPEKRELVLGIVRI